MNTHIHTNTHEQRFIMSDVEVSVIFARVFVREPRDRSGTFSIARDVCQCPRVRVSKFDDRAFRFRRN